MLSFRHREQAVSYQTTGHGSPVLLLPCAAYDCSIWNKVVDGLKDHHQVITLDYPGMGASEAWDRDYTTAELIDLINELMRHLHVDRFHLVGFSMGGFIAQHYAAQHPEHLLSLTLMGTVASVTEEIGMEFLRGEVHALQHDHSKSVILPSFAELGFKPQPVATLIRQFQYCQTHDAKDVLATIHTPTLVLCGEIETIATPHEGKKLAAMVKHGRCEVIAGCGHNLPLEAPQQINHLMHQHFSQADLQPTFKPKH